MKDNCWRIGKICRILALYNANSTQYCSKVRRTGKKMMSAENKHIGKKKKELVLILVILAVSALLYADYFFKTTYESRNIGGWNCD